MSEHTPGPWTYSRSEQYGDWCFYVGQADGAPYTPHYSDVATLIAETVSDERRSIQEANARLIAAAPDLLEAVQEFLEMTEEPPEPNCSCHIAPPCGDCVDHAGLRGAFKVARAAITKATGEQA